MQRIFTILVVLVSLCLQAPAQTTTHGITIPVSHPRLWFTPARVASAQSWFSAHPYTPTSDQWAQLGFAYIASGNASYCTNMIAHAMSTTITVGSNGSDSARGEGENLILAYDWCYDQMTQEQRDTLTANLNSWFSQIQAQAWGGATMPQDNYFWGNLRNELEWGIASYYENTTAAEAFINDALTIRWTGAFVPTASTSSKGGVFGEGNQYGRYTAYYATIPFQTAMLQGRDVFGDTEFWKSAVLFMIYQTTPAPTYNSYNTTTNYEVFPYSDDESWRNGATALSRLWSSNPGSYFGDWMQTMANYWPSTSIGRWAQQWVSMIGAGSYVNYHVQAFSGGTSPLSFSSLPIDYYAPGMQYFYLRKAWDTSSSIVNLQLGMNATTVGHQHSDLGNWQIWRGGRWLSRETTSYAETFSGFGGSGSVNSNDTAVHNSILINADAQGCSAGSTCLPGGGQGINQDVNGTPVVNRLESRSGYAYADVDLSSAYRNNIKQSGGHQERDNPAAKHVEREYVWVRDLETLVIFDRLESNAVGAVTAANIKKTFTAHCEVNWTLDDAQHSTCTNGSQALRLTTLVPASTTRSVVTEGGAVGQYRLEISDSGSAQSYFLHVLQSKATASSNISPSVVDNGGSYTVTLDGSHSLTLAKGMISSAGSITIDGTTTNLRSDVQGISVSDDGPVWASPQSTILTGTFTGTVR